MNMPIFKVVKPGLQTTVQDLGRYGYRKYGVSPSGAMDTYSLQMGNLLVGNKLGEPVLEVPFIGPVLWALHDVSIAICGGNLSPKINEQAIPLWKSLVIKKGQYLSFGKIIQGARAYISIAGGIQVPQVLASKSTYLTGKFGGLDGRALEKGDILYGHPLARRNRFLHESLIPNYPNELTVSVIMGPHIEKFTSFGVQTFLNDEYILSPQSNRMAFQLNGPIIEHSSGADIISDTIPLGGIQVPASGRPIILMAEHQTTGGYSRIGTVISTDITRLAQALPGTKIRFKEISIQSAQNLLIDSRKKIKCLYSLSRSL
ncbi:biotin-dependent carboxyltransferase family protein [Neobacillus sp. CF12]|uniref:5-oxoprolinase subunit C family protein n=1 Tax=Neobacillus sp. CF12 TaxID=3055864 RepID=UPI0025A30CF6|nr:biotin-dependent carboxyltransferase family protein [Neobacillus sp. CF12]MDM5327398.1 biotin-dependent carboxyltransferase family protein [Neobacillus sp. CF12]